MTGSLRIPSRLDPARCLNHQDGPGQAKPDLFRTPICELSSHFLQLLPIQPLTLTPPMAHAKQGIECMLVKKRKLSLNFLNVIQRVCNKYWKIGLV